MGRLCTTCTMAVKNMRRETNVFVFSLVCLCFFFASGLTFAGQSLLGSNENSLGQNPFIEEAYSTYHGNNLMPYVQTINCSLAGSSNFTNSCYYDLKAQIDSGYRQMGSHFNFLNTYANILRPAPRITTLALDWITNVGASGSCLYNFSSTIDNGMVSASALNWWPR